MFSPFFYLLRARGLDVSLSEWMTLLEALQKGLAHSSFTDFYYLSRMIIAKSEAEYDKFDAAFQEYFKNIELGKEPPDELLSWLNHKASKMDEEQVREKLPQMEWQDMSSKKIKEMYEKRLEEQKAPHNRGQYWIGQHGFTAYGNAGQKVRGIRVGGHSNYRSAFQIMGEQKYRDFREDKVLDVRQYQVALRKLRQFSSRLEIPKTELNLDATVDATCNNGGYLDLVFDRPRRNTVKLLLLMDSGGSMVSFSHMCTALFQAVDKSNYFKDVKIYYFHNCLYSRVFTTPECKRGEWLDTEWLFRNLDSEYKLLIIGDASMAPDELYDRNGNNRGPNGGLSGIEWFRAMRRKYKKAAWLNPNKHPEEDEGYWIQTEKALAKLFPMYQLSIRGLEDAMKTLLVAK